MTAKDMLLSNDLLKNLIGYESLFDRIDRSASNSPYPPYNIIKKDDSTYHVELACAGFDESEVIIELADGVLSICGTQSNQADGNDSYIYRGIAARNFTRKFHLNENIEVEGASMDQGILTVTLKHIVPEEKQPKRIAIERKPQLLTEN